MRLRIAIILMGIGVLMLGRERATAEEHMVSVSNFTFQPSELTIAAGDTVTWTNNGGFHNVRADDDSFRCANGCDGMGGNGAPSNAAWSFSLVFDDPGMIAYYCELHGAPGGVGMSGTIEVIDLEVFSDGFESGDTSAWSASVP